MSAARLYTPEVLGLATALADYPLAGELALTGSARSALCGSALDLALAVDGAERIAALGLKVQACAIGQAAAAIFARGAAGLSRAEIASAGQALRAWLEAESAPQPDWPGLAVLAPARAYPARHGAIQLAWRAALDALP